MSEPCRFDLAENVCTPHTDENGGMFVFRADICDLGLASLQSELSELRHYKTMTENKLIVYEKHEASPAYHALRTQLEAQARVIAGLREAIEAIDLTDPILDIVDHREIVAVRRSAIVWRDLKQALSPKET